MPLLAPICCNCGDRLCYLIFTSKNKIFRELVRNNKLMINIQLWFHFIHVPTISDITTSFKHKFSNYSRCVTLNAQRHKNPCISHSSLTPATPEKQPNNVSANQRPAATLTKNCSSHERDLTGSIAPAICVCGRLRVRLKNFGVERRARVRVVREGWLKCGVRVVCDFGVGGPSFQRGKLIRKDWARPMSQEWRRMPLLVSEIEYCS